MKEEVYRTNYVLSFIAKNHIHNENEEVPFMIHLNHEIREFIKFIRPSRQKIVVWRLLAKMVKEMTMNGLKETKKNKVDVMLTKI